MFPIKEITWTTTLFQREGRFLSFHSFFPSFLLPFCRAVRTYRHRFEWRDPIWGDDWSHSLFIKRSPSWGFLGFSSVVRQMPGDLCTAPRIISLSPLSLATNVTDATLEASDLWLGTRTGADGTATRAWSFFGRSLWLHEGKKIHKWTYICDLCLVK